MDLGLKGKVAIVTGGASGMGHAIVRTFAEEGVNVVVADIDRIKGEQVAQEAQDLGVKALMVKTDVTKLDQAERTARLTLEKFGDIDILANVAGAWVVKRFAEMTPEEWDYEIGVCYYGVLNCTKAVIHHMIEQKKGKIVSIASDAGRVGEPDEPVYAGAKAAVIGFSKGLAKDVGRHGIHVNVVSPSFTWVDYLEEEKREVEARGDPEELEKYKARWTKILKFYPLRKIGTPQDVANMLVFLASERANHMTGQTISVNGGYCMI